MSFDADAQDYILRVLDAGELLLPHVQAAIDRFVVGCKSDSSPVAGVSNWDAIKASCFLAGPQTLNGIRVPLKGAFISPPGSLFVEDDYDQLLGLKGDGVSKRWRSDRYNWDDPTDNASLAIFVTELGTSSITIASDTNPAGREGRLLQRFADRWRFMCNGGGLFTRGLAPARNPPGLLGVSRHTQTEAVTRADGISTPFAGNADISDIQYNIMIFGQGNNAANCSDARISFYSIGEAVDLELLDHRVSRYMKDIATPARRGFPLSRMVN